MRTQRIMKATLIRDDGRYKVYQVDEIGHVAVCYIEPRSSNNPSERPWHLICWGSTHATPEAAIEHAIASWNKPETTLDRTYEREEAAFCGPGRFERE